MKPAAALLLPLSMAFCAPPAYARLQAGVHSLPVQCLDETNIEDFTLGQSPVLSGSGSLGANTNQRYRMVVAYSPHLRRVTVYLVDPSTRVACVLTTGQLYDRGT